MRQSNRQGCFRRQAGYKGKKKLAVGRDSRGFFMLESFFCWKGIVGDFAKDGFFCDVYVI